MPTQLLNIRSIFDRAIVIATEIDRKAYLDEACAAAPEIRVQVEALLQAHAQAGSFLNAAADRQRTQSFDPIDERPGTVIGPYKLLQQIGEGGMGVVFMAEQERPVRRRVALKIIKPGMDTREVIGRFEAERQTLAMMDHPNIAKVLDAGTTGEGSRDEGLGTRASSSAAAPTLDPRLSTLNDFSGRPYFVMELVRGVPITDYCDQCYLTTRGRLELFITVCHAVQHAHQKGIIHRDIKPTNVLVTMQDGRPAPKIIDFGVAKAINQRLTEHTLMTAFTQMLGTPLYMSPEQAELSPLGVDTRSDIYSLGVLLYELLTGTTPFNKDRLHAAPYDEFRRIIREEEPPRPSARLSTLAADLATTVAEDRRTDARRLVQIVRGDLDWIVMKCLEKDRTQRYDSANELALDIERYLNDEPVLASPPSWITGLTKWVHRHRAATIAAGVLTLVIMLGATVTAVLLAREQAATTQALHESEAKERALQVSNEELEKERKRAEENLRSARAAVDRMLTRVAGDLTDKPHLTEVQRALLEDALAFYQKFLQQDEDDPALRQETARAYIRVSHIQSALGRIEEAEQSALRATSLLEELVKAFPADRSYLYDLFSAYTAHTSALGGGLRPEMSVETAERLVSQARSIAEQNPSDPSHWELVASYETGLGNAYKQGGTASQAETHLREGLRILEELYDDHPELPQDRSNLAEARLWLGCFLLEMRKLEEAEPLLDYCLAFQRERLRAHPDSTGVRGRLVYILRNKGQLRYRQRKYDEARKLLQEAIDIGEKQVDDFPDIRSHRQVLAASYHILADVLWAAGREDDGDDSLRRATFHRDILVKAAPKLTIQQQDIAGWSHFILGTRLHARGREAEAMSEYRRAQDLFEEAVEKFPQAFTTNLGFAQVLATCPAPQFRDPERAAVHVRRALQRNPESPEAWRILGIALYLSRDWPAAEQAFVKSFELRSVDRHAEDVFYRAILATQLNKPDDARRWYQTGVDQWPDGPAPPPWVRQLRDETAAMLGVSAPSNHSSDEPSERVEEPAHESKSNEPTGGDKSSPKPD